MLPVLQYRIVTSLFKNSGRFQKVECRASDVTAPSHWTRAAGRARYCWRPTYYYTNLTYWHLLILYTKVST